MSKFGLSASEEKIFRKLSSPQKIQDYLDKIPINFEPNGDTCRSPREMLKQNKAHCIEGALFAAAVFMYHGKPPLLLDLKATDDDFDHVVAPFRVNGLWGAVSKVNHAVLRWREPVYKTFRELAMSYFHEYFLHSGKKTLRSFSKPFSLKKYGTKWITAKDNVWYIPEDLDKSAHDRIVPRNLKMRKADRIEIEAGKILEYKPPKGLKENRI